MENVKKTLNGFRLDAELKNVPVSFVNALRRILLSEVPTVVVTNVQILDNTTQMTHEMIRHRVEMLPINVRADETATVRDTKIELRFMPSPDRRTVTSDDFVINGPRKNVLLRDRELDKPLLFMYLNPNESLHIKATIGIETKNVSQVCVSTFKNHIDPDRAAEEKEEFVRKGGNPKVFDNFNSQRSYAVDENGRPYWFDFSVESIGVSPAADLIKKAVGVLQEKIVEWCKIPVQRDSEGGFSIESTEGHTLGYLVQEMMYRAGMVDSVSYAIPHPLESRMVVRFTTKLRPDAIVDRFRAEAVALCESILKSV
jgi:DNA-directed RNA polymerase subunit L